MNVPVSPRDMHVHDDATAKGQAVLDSDELRLLDAYWRAANYLSVGQIYLYDKPAAARASDAGACQAACGRALGNDARAEFHLRPFEPDDPTHDLDMIYIAGPATAARPWSPTPISRAATAKSIPTSAGTKPG